MTTLPLTHFPPRAPSPGPEHWSALEAVQGIAWRS